MEKHRKCEPSVVDRLSAQLCILLISYSTLGTIILHLNFNLVTSNQLSAKKNKRKKVTRQGQFDRFIVKLLKRGINANREHSVGS